MRRVPDPARHERKSLLAAAALVIGVLIITYIAFGHPTIGGKYEIDAIVTNGNQLRSGSPVRIAGVDVGQVTGVERGPGHTARIRLRINDNGLPLHKDATLKIRPRLFLEGGFYVDLRAGSPSAPELSDGGTIPRPQTAVPVQLNDLLSSLDLSNRTSFRHTVHELDVALSGGGAKSFRRIAPEIRPVLRDLAWVAEAARGTAPHDVSQLIRSTARITGGLAANQSALAGLVSNLDTTAAALSSGDDALGRTVASLDRLLRAAPPALTGLDSALPSVVRFSRAIEPGVRTAPRALRNISAAVTELGALVAPEERTRVLRALKVTFDDLPTLVDRLAGLFPVTRPLTECLARNVTPILTSKVDDGALSTGQPVWQEFAHSLVGLAGISQNFDANGFALRYDAGMGAAGFSTEAIPGVGQVAGALPPVLRSRPVWLGRGVKPAFRPDERCTDQPVPDLSSETLTVRTHRVARGRKAPRITAAGLKKLLEPKRLRKALEAQR
jgi:virulence factor Mce-like protein